jgi:polyisoprenoid-binding protein YceI
LIQLKNSNKTMATATTWVIDPTHSEVQFKIKHLVISTVTGSFKTFEGTVETENDGFEGAKIQFSADIDSIDTNMAQRDAHLKSADFFDAENFPKLSFVSSSFTQTDEENYVLTGDLTIRGVSLPVTLSAIYGGQMVDFYGNTKAGFEISGKINRKDFGLNWGAVTEAGGVVVSDEVKLHINVQVAKQA